MTSRRFSALLGFILLIGCMVGIGVVIFGLGPSSYSLHGPEESFTEWHSKDFKGPTIVTSTEEKSVYEKNDLSEEFDRIFSKIESSSNSSTTTVISVKNKSPNTNTPESPKFPKVVPTIDTKDRSEDAEEALPRVTEYHHLVDKLKDPEIFDKPLTTVNTPLIIPKLQLRGLVVPTVSLPPMWPISSDDLIVNPAVAAEGAKNENDESYEENPEWQNARIPENENRFDDEPYFSEQDDENGSTMMELGDLLSLATNLYIAGTNSSGVHNFLRVINETLNQGNNSGILTQLNELYSRPEIVSTLGSGDIFVGRNSYETSLTAFVFMSFGVFLLNQIHSLINKEIEHDGGQGQSRQFRTDYLEESNLSILFEPPYNNLTLETENNSGRSIDGGDGGYVSEDSGFSMLNPKYVNNIFRGFLNLVNAYTKNSQALECIWSLYCRDLDKTSANEGLYGIAARINSIGLRLIMHQIPTELTLDVMLRSLLGWDGLPCKKMFTACDAEEASAALRAAGSSNKHSI